MAARRSNKSRAPASRPILPPRHAERSQKSTLLGVEADGGSYGRTMLSDIWYEEEDAGAMEQERSAAAGDCGRTRRSADGTSVLPSLYDGHDRLTELEDHRGPAVGRRAYSEQLDRRPPHRRQANATLSGLSGTQSDKTVGQLSVQLDDDVDQWDLGTRRRHRTTRDLHLPTDSSRPTPTTTSLEQTVDHVTDRRSRRPRGVGLIRDDAGTVSEPAVQSSTYSRYDDVDRVEDEDRRVDDKWHISRTDSDEMQSSGASRRRRSKVSRMIEHEDMEDDELAADVAMSRPSYMEQHHDAGAPTDSLHVDQHFASQDPSQRCHDLRQQSITEEPANVPRRLVFRRRGSTRQRRSDNAEQEQDDGAHESMSLTKRLGKVENVRSLVRAVNKAAMRVNPTNPDAFLSMLSLNSGHAERLDDGSIMSSRSVQTDEVLPEPIDDSPSRIRQLQREMENLTGQQRTLEIITYVMASIAVILLVMFAKKLWDSVHLTSEISSGTNTQDSSIPYM